MGRTITFYVISNKIEHDKSKFCFDFEFEPEQNDWEYTEKYYKMINPHIKDLVREDYPNEKEYSKAICNRINEQNNLWNSLNYKDLWCPKCNMYKYGIWSCDFIINKMYIFHSYSNPIWESEWNIGKCYLGSSNTNFTRRFSKKDIIREITEEDIIHEYERIEKMGEPILTSDIEAKEETIRVLDFLERYSNREDVYLIVLDEY